MNGRIHREETPEGRLAAVVRSLVIQREDGKRQKPDYADFRDALRPFVRLELLRARIDEARLYSSELLTERMRALVAEFLEAEKALPAEDRLL